MNKFSLQVLTYHKKESKYSICTFTKHFHKHRQALSENHRERRASRFIKTHLDATGREDGGGQVVTGWPADHPAPVPKVGSLTRLWQIKGSKISQETINQGVRAPVPHSLIYRQPTRSDHGREMKAPGDTSLGVCERPMGDPRAGWRTGPSQDLRRPIPPEPCKMRGTKKQPGGRVDFSCCEGRKRHPHRGHKGRSPPTQLLAVEIFS